MKWMDILDRDNESTENLKKILENKYSKTYDILKEAFYGSFVGKEEAKFRIEKEFVDPKKAPKTIDIPFLKENMDYVLKQLETLDEGEIKIIIKTNDSCGACAGGGEEDATVYTIGEKKGRGRPKKVKEEPPVKVDDTEKVVTENKDDIVGKMVMTKDGKEFKVESIDEDDPNLIYVSDADGKEKSIMRKDINKIEESKQETQEEVKEVTEDKKTFKQIINEGEERMTIKWSDIEKYLGETETEDKNELTETELEEHDKGGEEGADKDGAGEEMDEVEYEVEKDEDGNPVLDDDGNPVYKLDDEGNKIPVVKDEEGEETKEESYESTKITGDQLTEAKMYKAKKVEVKTKKTTDGEEHHVMMGGKKVKVHTKKGDALKHAKKLEKEEDDKVKKSKKEIEEAFDAAERAKALKKSKIKKESFDFGTYQRNRTERLL